MAHNTGYTEQAQSDKHSALAVAAKRHRHALGAQKLEITEVRLVVRVERVVFKIRRPLAPSHFVVTATTMHGI